MKNHLHSVLLALLTASLAGVSACGSHDSTMSDRAPLSPIVPASLNNEQDRTDYQQCAQDCDNAFYAGRDLLIDDYSACLMAGLKTSDDCWQEYLDDLMGKQQRWQECMDRCASGGGGVLPRLPDCGDWGVVGSDGPVSPQQQNGSGDPCGLRFGPIVR